MFNFSRKLLIQWFISQTLEKAFRMNEFGVISLETYLQITAERKSVSLNKEDVNYEQNVITQELASESYLYQKSI